MAVRKDTSRNNTGKIQTDQEKVSAVFTKEQILFSAAYKSRRDLVSALLEDGKRYTLETVNKKIEEFMKGKVG